MTSLLSRHKFLLTLLVLIILSLLSSAYWFLLLPPHAGSAAKIVTIKRGMPLSKISAVLEQEGLIRNRHLFVGITALLGKKGEIKAGEYELHAGMSSLQILSMLVRGQVKRHVVTVVEGYTIYQIAQLLEDSGITGKEAFLQKAFSAPFVLSLDLFHPSDAPRILTVEGYLFPDTYYLVKEMDPEEIIQTMVQRFKKVFSPEAERMLSQVGMSQREVVILASIIEKETPLPEEKPLVSAVLHNRLKRRIPLQSDPTVIYGVRNFDGNLKKRHLLTRTPYNTYLFSGVPPTPICNPGRESLLAALRPAVVPYLYFVSRNDGSHHFSSTIREHNQAVWRYQKQRSPRKP